MFSFFGDGKLEIMIVEGTAMEPPRPEIKIDFDLQKKSALVATWVATLSFLNLFRFPGAGVTPKKCP